jgi:NAD-dependent DNA ligase
MEQIKLDLSFIRDTFYEYLLRGDPSVLTDANICALNQIAMRLYWLEKEEMNDDCVECLKYIIMICNLLYNRTDMEVLPIEDGVYDLLLEKYKVFDPHFQVGSAVVDFRSTIPKDFDKKEPVCPIVFLEKRKESDDPIVQHIRANIMRDGLPILNFEDTNQCPVVFGNQTISKRTHTTEHNHPSLVGTLDKSKFVLMVDAVNMGVAEDPNVKILERDFFQEHIKAGIITPNQRLEMVLELKYDGLSVEADCTNIVESARTRGDTGIGVAADITPILHGYLFKHAKSRENANPIGVKFEAIMTRTALAQFNIARNTTYANCRTAIIGLFGAGDAYLYRDYITLVPLAVDRNDVPEIQNRIDEINFTNEFYRSNGEPLRYCVIRGNYVECLYQIKKFQEEAKAAREYLDFMYDGIVVSYLDPDICERLGRVNYINKYSMAVKFDPLCKTTTFRGYTYEVGQTGTIIPIIHYDPVEFYGTIHTKCSGASLARFQELSLKYGDHIDVTYVNDVMPYVTKPDCEYNRNNPNPVILPPEICPVCGSKLVVSESGKTLKCENLECPARLVGRTVNMLSKLNLKGFGKSMIEAIGVYNLRDLMNLDREYLAPRIGEGNASNFLEIMDRLKTEPIYDYQIIGSLGFTNVGAKKWQIIFSQITLKNLIELYDYDVDNFYAVLSNKFKGIGPITSECVTLEMDGFIDDIRYIIDNMPNVKDSMYSVTGKQIRFTGCRNLQLEKQLCNEGHDANSNASVTKQTDILLVPYEGYTSTKTKRMPDTGIIVSIQDFMNNPQYYLGLNRQ